MKKSEKIFLNVFFVCYFLVVATIFYKLGEEGIKEKHGWANAIVLAIECGLFGLAIWYATRDDK